ncbi:WhiB family transcriptional regulator [Streptomyces sp. URMC 129]|uniref:WhiB family transcriptional regulator n=1 Tax=Streptomyces sp. URMC 129 TaxID=3423407 RepID=UPI003F1B1034
MTVSRTQAHIAARRAEVLRATREGVYQATIAARFGVSLATITADVAALRRQGRLPAARRSTRRAPVADTAPPPAPPTGPVLRSAQAWADAACLGRDTDDWYDPRTERRALARCARCPLRAACLDLAMRAEVRAPGHRYGIFGGLTPEQRDDLHRVRRDAARGDPT